MEKLSISKLIANDIVNYGMDKTTSFNYIVSLNDFLDDYDFDTCNYIKSHIKEIISDVEKCENVADLIYDEERQEFNIVFYFDNLITPLERKIYDYASSNFSVDYELDDLRELSYKIEHSEEYNNLIISAISNDLGKEI